MLYCGIMSYELGETSKRAQIEAAVAELAVAHEAKTVPHLEYDDIYYPRLSFVWHQPPTTAGEPDFEYCTPEKLRPYVLDILPYDWRIQFDVEAEVRAEPWSAERNRLERQRLSNPNPSLYIPRRTPAHKATLNLNTMADAQPVRELDDNSNLFDDWLNVFAPTATRTVYKPNIEGILRQDKLPDGRRIGPDRLAFHTDIAQHHRAVEASHMSFLRRIFAAFIGKPYG
jgi:hypothetical protein